jgi:hypothetical protein
MNTPAPPSATVSSPLLTPIVVGSPAVRTAGWSWAAGASTTSPLPRIRVRGA